MTAEVGLLSVERKDLEPAELGDPGGPRDALRTAFSDPERLDHWARCYLAGLRRQGLPEAGRRETMKAVNPQYVLRDHLAQVAIAKATNERDYGEIACIQRLLPHPFDEQPGMATYTDPAPAWAEQLSASCSS
jgi:uncharacterized protein YdiU (UPF0061 family)